MRNLLWIIIAVVIIGGGYWWWSMSAQPDAMVNENAASAAPVTETAGTTTPETSATEPATSPQTVTVTYDGKTYTPATVTIKSGDTIMFKNTSGKNMWVASDEHPTHTEYDGTSRSAHCAAGYTGEKPFDQCKAESADYSFTFMKAGAIEFHDHLNPSVHGTVTVQ